MGIILGLAVAGGIIVLFFFLYLVGEPVGEFFREIGDWLGDHQIAILIAIILAIGAFAGLRSSEIMRLDWADVRTRKQARANGVVVVPSLGVKDP